MSAPAVARRLQLLERAWPWLAALALALALLAGAMTLAIGGDEPVDFRGHSGPASIMAAVAVVTALVAAFYSLRKRALQERLGPRAGSMMTWLWLHVALGSIALCAAALHGGYGLLDWRLSSGTVLFAVFALLFASGVVWRLVYRLVPAIASARIGNYAAEGHAERAAAQALEIEKLAAGRSADFHRLKQWIIDAGPSLERVNQAALYLPDAAERPLAAEVWRLADSSRRALGRARLQRRFTRILQGMKLLHVPLTLLFVPLLVAHVIGASQLPARLLPIGAVPLGALSGFAPSRACARCHAAIYRQWSTSMHSQAVKSPVTLAQNNQLVRLELGAKPSPDPRQFCVNCHAPLGAALGGSATLPAARAGYDDALLGEGISCAACHQFAGASAAGSAGFSRFQASLVPGSLVFGNLDKPRGNAFHQSASAPIHAEPDTLCVNCHTVQYDRNGDGRFDKAIDLVLQTTNQEYDEYRASGGGGTCVSCHMPATASTRAAEAAEIPAEQDADAPPRAVHDHSFVGVDYPIDTVAIADPNRAAREELLRSAARLELDAAAGAAADKLTFRVRITNAGAGHNLPTGFAFARQMWLEIKVSDPGGALVASSGVLADNAADLCDAATLDDEKDGMARFVVGCAASDPQLVNFQAKLVDRTEPAKDDRGAFVRDARGDLVNAPAPGAAETWLQRLDGGVVTRVRRSDKQAMATIPPGATRAFAYQVALAARPAALTISARLLFRNLPPYFLRALAAGQPKSEEPRLERFIPNLRVVEMAAQTVTVPLGQ